MYPHNTEMDLSIANALYFAARGEGLVENQPYATTARVLFSGLGADELFGGYIRHKTAYAHRGFGGLLDELKLDVGRLGKRNLGRDDRVMAHWGREVRFPFLDERLVHWAVESPVWDKCDFANPAVEDPDKRVLRLVAESLGLVSVAREKKRAVSCAILSNHSVYGQEVRHADHIRFNSAPERPRWRAARSRGRHPSLPESKCFLPRILHSFIEDLAMMIVSDTVELGQAIRGPCSDLSPGMGTRFGSCSWPSPFGMGDNPCPPLDSRLGLMRWSRRDSDDLKASLSQDVHSTCTHPNPHEHTIELHQQ